MRAVMGAASSGLVPQVTIGAISAPSSDTSRSNVAPSSLGRVRQYLSARVPGCALRRERPAAEVLIGRVVRRDHAGAAAAFDRHVADREAAFDRERADGAAGVLDDVADGAGRADLGDDGEDHVLAGDAEAELAVDSDAHASWACAATAICVASTCVTSEEPMPKASAPSAPCVEVWLSPQTMVRPGSVMPCSGPDHMDDALPPVADVEHGDAGLGAMPRHRCHQQALAVVGDGSDVARVGRDVVIGRAEAAVRAPHVLTYRFQALEGEERAVVQDVPVDVEQRVAVRPVHHHMAAPDLLEHGGWLRHVAFSRWLGARYSAACFLSRDRRCGACPIRRRRSD